jgi:hypothetical protein
VQGCPGHFHVEQHRVRVVVVGGLRITRVAMVCVDVLGGAADPLSRVYHSSLWPETSSAATFTYLISRSIYCLRPGKLHFALYFLSGLLNHILLPHSYHCPISCHPYRVAISGVLHEVNRWHLGSAESPRYQHRPSRTTSAPSPSR